MKASRVYSSSMIENSLENLILQHCEPHLDFNAFQYIFVPFSTFQYISVHFRTFQYISIHFNTFHYISVHFNTIQYNEHFWWSSRIRYSCKELFDVAYCIWQKSQISRRFFARKRPDVLPKDILMQVTQKKTREKLSETNWKWEKITTF